MLRVSEVYASTQGEGPNVGKTVVFVRFAGCNLRCEGWPCDTPHAIFPDKYRKEWHTVSVVELVNEVIKVARMSGAKIITLTGGEPFLQNHDHLAQFVSVLLGSGYMFEAFTNGTIEYPDWVFPAVGLIVDWKLFGSGEDPKDKVRIKNIEKIQKASMRLGTYKTDSVKFVAKDLNDLHLAHALWKLYLRDEGFPFTFVGRVWDSELTDAEIVQFVMDHKLPWRLNMQMHNYIWPAHERAR